MELKICKIHYVNYIKTLMYSFRQVDGSETAFIFSSRGIPLAARARRFAPMLSISAWYSSSARGIKLEIMAVRWYH